jgi:RHS repeat-associated protein
VDQGGTAQYVYNALNQRAQATVNGVATGYLFNATGQRVSEWNGTTQLQGKYEWGARPVAYYAHGVTHFEHQDWLGTERMRTSYNGTVEGTFASLPFGDGQATTGVDTDANHYAQLDQDVESWTAHAQARQYSNLQGRWLSPDPYHGSYKWRNPQSFNRYAYVGNNPLAATDPLGQEDCPDFNLDNGEVCYGAEMSGDGGGSSAGLVACAAGNHGSDCQRDE